MTGPLSFMPLDPVLIAYAANRSSKTGRTHWTRVGMAFPHEQGAGLTVVLDSMPLNGIVILLERGDDDDERLATMSPEDLGAASRGRTADSRKSKQ